MIRKGLLIVGVLVGVALFWDQKRKKIVTLGVDDLLRRRFDTDDVGVLPEEEAIEVLEAYIDRVRATVRERHNTIPVSNTYWDVANIHLWMREVYGKGVAFSDKRLDSFLRNLGNVQGKYYFVSDANRQAKSHQRLERFGWTIHYKRRDMTLLGTMAGSRGLLGGVGRFFVDGLGAKPYRCNVDEELKVELRRSGTEGNTVVLLSGDHGYVDDLSRLPKKTIKLVISGKEALARVLRQSSDEYLNASLFLYRPERRH